MKFLCEISLSAPSTVYFRSRSVRKYLEIYIAYDYSDYWIILIDIGHFNLVILDEQSTRMLFIDFVEHTLSTHLKDVGLQVIFTQNS